MLTVVIAGGLFLAGLLGTACSLSAIRRYHKKAWYLFWLSIGLCAVSGGYFITWFYCYGSRV